MPHDYASIQNSNEDRAEQEAVEQKKPSAAAMRIQQNFLSPACDEGYRRNLEVIADNEIQRMINALDLAGDAIAGLLRGRDDEAVKFAQQALHKTDTVLAYARGGGAV